MSVVIRMKRIGRRNAPCYRISVADSRSPRDGRTLESLGIYDPISPVPELRLKLDVERARTWIQRGAKPSETVASIFTRSGVYEGVTRAPKKRDRAGRKKKTATRAAKTSAAAARAEAKTARAKQRKAARAAAKKAAAAAEGTAQ